MDLLESHELHEQSCSPHHAIESHSRARADDDHPHSAFKAKGWVLSKRTGDCSLLGKLLEIVPANESAGRDV